MTTPSLTATVFPRVSRIPAVLRDVFRQEAVFLGIIAGYVAIVVAVGVILDRPALAGFLSYFQRSLALVIVVPFAMVVNARIRDIKAGVPASLDAYKKALREVVETKLTAKALTRFVAVFVPLMVFLAAFSGYKQMFYLFTGYTWDAPFAVLDRVLHGGYDPWVLTDMVLHSQWATIITDRIYFGLWAMAMMGVTVWELWHEESPRRKQYLITFVLSWIIIGSLLPTLFPSGGPTYYTEFTGEPSFIATHKEYLRSIPGLSAVTIQDGLWANYKLDLSLAVGGIAAMPSMHVAMGELLAILGRNTSRLWGTLGTLFSLAILVGSVHLGPHYAVDGYVAIIFVHVIWRVVGRMLRRDPSHARA